MIATLAIPDGFRQGRVRLRDDPRFQSRLSAALRDHLTRPFTPPIAGTSPDELRALYAAHRDGVQSLVQAGATLLVGTDASAGGTPAAHGISIHREIEPVVGIGLTMLVGIGLVALSMVVMLRVTAGADPLAREDLSFALAVILLGLLLMVSRRNAVSQIVGFMSLENGLVLAATGAKGMPLVVEISVAFSILIAFIVIGVFLFRIRERFDTVDVHALDRHRGGQGEA